MADQQPAQREVPCPACTGSKIPNYAGKAFSKITSFFSHNFNITLATDALTYIKEHLPVSDLTILGGKCAACNSTGKIKDPSDDSAKYREVKAKVIQLAPAVATEEAKLSPAGGNISVTTQGDSTLQCGLGMNVVPSYRIDEGKSLRGFMQTVGPEGVTRLYDKKNHIQGTNPTASPGGICTIVCSNKFNVLTGALGVEISTGGPITISGGQTRITGAEVTIGCESGTLALGGEVVSIGAKSIEVAPTNGSFLVKGHIHGTGDMVIGGHAHLESASIINLKMAGKNKTSKISSPSDLVTGPSKWGGTSESSLLFATYDLMGLISQNTADFSFSQSIISPRGKDALLNKMLNMNYAGLAKEPVISGYAYVAGVPTYPVYLYPHVHSLPDQRLTVDTFIPDIDTVDTSKDVRKSVVTNPSGAPTPVQRTSVFTALASIFLSASTVAALKKNTYTKFLFSPSA